MDPMKEQIIKEYWLNKLSGDLPGLSLPLMNREESGQPAVSRQSQAKHHNREIPAPLSAKLNKAAKNNDIAMFILVLSGINILLNRYTGVDDLVIGAAPPAGHEHDNLFIFCRNRIPGAITARELITQVKADVLTSIKYAGCPIGNLEEMLRHRNNTGAVNIFNAAFIYEPNQKKNPDLERFELLIILSSTNREPQIQIEYPAGPGAQEIIEGFTQNLITALECILDKPGQQICRLEILSPREKKRLLNDFNRTETAYPRDKSLHRLFAEQVQKNPDQIALLGVHQVHETSETPETPRKNYNMSHMSHMSYMSYKELDQESAALAEELAEKGVKPGVIVGIMVERTLQMIIGIWAILKAGGAYLPLDPEYPPARIKYIIKNSNTAILLTREPLIRQTQEQLFTGEIIDIFNRELNRGPGLEGCPGPGVEVNPTDPAYVIYTSGSTGSPKGVMVWHGNAVNFVKGMTSVIDFSPGKTILALTTISFDIFLLETLVPLVCGMKVIIVAEAEQQDPQMLADMIRTHRVRMIQATPSRLQLLLEIRDDMRCFTGVKELIVGGEAFPPSLFETVKTHYQGKIYNVYGPTETTVWSTIKELTPSRPKKITIGRPIANTRVYIVDKRRRVQPLGVTGELLIGGDGVTAGYLNNPELTAEKFDHDLWDLQDYQDEGAPFGQIIKAFGERKKAPDKKNYRSHRSYTSYTLYLTGDLARWLPGGEIEFQGRQDHQVKIRGFRIELEEIEEQLAKHPGIKEAVVVAKTNQKHDKYLAAYIVPGSIREENETALEIEAITRHLTQRLPHYMIPSYFIPLRRIPLTPNGKIDRKALPEPEAFRLKPVEKYEAPATEMEKITADIWKQELGLEKIGVNDNVFSLGATSLDLVKVNQRLKENFARNIPMVALFRYRTIRAFTRYLDQAQGDSLPILPAKDRTNAIKRGERDKLARIQMRKRSK